MLLQRTGGVERRCPRRWALAAGAGLTGLAVLAAGLSIQPTPAGAAEPKTPPPPVREVEKVAPAPKADAPADPFKDALEQLKKDLGGDPALSRMLDELLKDGPKAPPAPPALPGLPRIQPLDDKELDEVQDLLRQQLEMLQKQLQGAGVRGGGFVLGPDGLRPLGAAGVNRGGVRLGVRVERPSDVLSSQLDLPAGQGLVCVDVPADSVAGRAGIRPHDVLLELGGKPVPSDFPEFQKVLAEVKADTPIDIVVLRKGKKETIKGVKLPEPKPVADFPALPDFRALELPAPFAPLPPPPPPGGAGAGVTVGPGETARVEQVNDAFTVFYSKGNVKVTIAGTKEGGSPKAESIEVDDNGKTHKAESIDKLPKEYQEMARNALKAVK